MPIFNNQLAGAAGQGGAAAFKIDRSLRFNSADSAYLDKTFSSAGNRKTWTWSGWVKRSKLGAKQQIFGVQGTNDTTYAENYFASDDKLYLRYGYNSVAEVRTTQVFRDPSAWLHIVIVFDVTQSANTDKLKLYINGSEVTSFSTDTRSSFSNQDYGINRAGAHKISGEPNASSSYLDAYLADVHFIDGQALAASDFGETDADTGVWNPKEYEGTYGTNGFHLDFSDASSNAALGEDSSGNNNDWTVNNLSVASGAGNDSLIDTPTNYTASPNNGGNYATLNPLDGSPSGLSNGNLDAASANAYPTIFPGSGQWYYEVNGTGYTWDGTRANWTARAGSHNFGQRPFSGTPNSGHVALCTTNLTDPTIADGSDYFDVATDTGANILSSTKALCNNGADFLWIKDRVNNSTNHHLIDIVRDPQLDGTPFLASNSTSSEATLGTYSAPSGNSVGWAWDAGTTTDTNNTAGSITPTGVRANPSAGFSIVTYTGNNTTSTVGHGLNATPGLVIVKSRSAASLTGWMTKHSSLSSNYNLALNLYDAAWNPATNGWVGDLTSSTTFSLVNGSSNGNNVNQNGVTYVAYCFAPVEGYSSFGSYQGNGSSDGPFVYTGHRSRFLLIKADIAGEDWVILDTERETYNTIDSIFFANDSLQEITNSAYNTDILSNGFKLRGSNPRFNQSGATYIFASFAESPFKYSRAR